MKLIRSLTGIVCALAITSCGVVDTANQTKDGVLLSNTKQDQLIELMKRMEELTKKLDQQMTTTNQGIEKTNKGMEKTNHGVHLQILTVALQQMLAKENTEQLSPPARMMPYASVFAGEASSHELIEAFHIFYVDATLGNATKVEEPNEVDVRVFGRSVSWAGGGAIAAFASDEQFDEIQKQEVLEQGRYKGTAMAFAVARYNMLRDAFLKAVLGDGSARSIGGLRKAVGYYQSMKKIAVLDYFNRDGARQPFTVILPQFSFEKEEIIPDPTKPNEKKIITKFTDREETVDPSEVIRLGIQCKSAFGKVPGDEAKNLREQFN